MKKTSYFFLIAIFGAFLLNSCSSGTPESLSVIPKDANFVASMDVRSVFQKAKFEELRELKSVKLLEKELKNENRSVADIFEKIMESPGSTGIDFTKEIFMFQTTEAENEMYMCFAMDLSNRAEFSKFIQDFHKAVERDFETEKEGDYEYAALSREVILGWDDKKVILMSAMNYKSRKNLDIELEILMELREGKNIVADEAFNKFYSESGDLNLWLKSDVLETMQSQEPWSEWRKTWVSVWMATTCLLISISMTTKYLWMPDSLPMMT